MNTKFEKDKRRKKRKIQIMEITESCLLKFDIAKLVLRPPWRPGDIADIEMILSSNNVPASIRGYVTVEANNKHNARSYPSLGNTMSRSAKRRLRMGMEQLAIQLRGELEDG